MQRPHYRVVALWSIFLSLLVILIGRAVSSSFGEASLVGALLLGLLAGFAIWAVLAWIQVPRRPTGLASIVLAVVVFLITWLRCRADSEVCRRTLGNALFYVPLIVVLAGSLVLFFTHRRQNAGGEAH
jgi:predicted ABC-type sugar transport system permease subunit